MFLFSKKPDPTVTNTTITIQTGNPMVNLNINMNDDIIKPKDYLKYVRTPSDAPPGVAVALINPKVFSVNDKVFGTIPMGKNTVIISDTELEFQRYESPFNIKCCAGRLAESSHFSNVKLMRHSRGDRPVSVLIKYIFLAALIAVAVAYGTQTEQEKIRDVGIGVGVAVFVPLFILWFLNRKAFFGYTTDADEGSAIEASLAPEGIKVSQFDIESVLQASWAAWSRYRNFRPSFDFNPLKISDNTKTTQVEPNTTFTHRKCGAPAGGDYLSVVENQAVIIKQSKGFCNLDIFSASIWQGFWCDDVQWLNYSLGGRTRRGFFAALLLGIGVGLGIAFGAYNGQQRDNGDATGPAAAGGAGTAIIFLIRWYLSAIVNITFGLTHNLYPNVRVPQIGSNDTYESVTKALFRRPVDTSNVITKGGKINGKDVFGNQVELSVTPDITEIKIFQGAKSALEKLICRLCSDQSIYRCRTSDLKFVYSSMASIVNSLIFAVTSGIIGIVVTVLLVPKIKNSPEQIDAAKQQGIGISIGICVLIILYAICTRKSVVVLGTPLSKPMPVIMRVLDALGLLDPNQKYLYRVEFVALTFGPEETVKVISNAIRANKAKTKPVEILPAPIVTGLDAALQASPSLKTSASSANLTITDPTINGKTGAKKAKMIHILPATVSAANMIDNPTTLGSQV